ncbi:NosD domain-containing protein [Neogemmobacter tilapiae]|uniref:Periplasmic copper-binding protein NosD beta helix domain-containing protein n=1 Tax=Neogemmobacter tilapiae TaxID=875041 RepID=A0A918WL90_9RHOB|nr:right-handed parallel beta-helix repeat-containing protein [Gemmobacter tilapiae]GHC56662.1 hypothetical protein GCM10007315_20040 [Gemmobacter tilapiae]
MGWGKAAIGIWLCSSAAVWAEPVSREQAEAMRLALGLAAPMALASPPIQSPPLLPGPARAEFADLQAALTQVAILSGANDQLALIKAQQGPALYLRGGQTTLPELARMLKLQGDDALTFRDGAYHLSRPLIVWSDAALSILPGEELVMDRAAGAFLISFGDLRLQGGHLSGAGAAPTASPDFAPFVLVAGQGTLWAEGAEFSALGLTGTRLFGGVTVMTQGLTAPKAPVHLLGNQFHAVGKLALIGTDKARVQGNALSGPLLLDGGQGALLLDNDIRPDFGTGLRITGGATASRVQGNLVQGAATGILVDRGAVGLIITGNMVLGNTGDGIRLSRGTCAQVAGNLVQGNAAVGLRLNDQIAASVTGNAFLDNGTAAIDLSGQSIEGGTTRLEANLIAGNREGLRGAGIGSVLMLANRTQDQLPRLFGGEFAAHLPAYLTETQKGEGQSFLITAAGGAAQAAPDCQGGM